MPEDTRPVSTISLGVLGITGIETMEILKGVVDNVKPKLLIVIDALASRSIDGISVVYRLQILELLQAQESKINEKR